MRTVEIFIPRSQMIMIMVDEGQANYTTTRSSS